MTFLPREPGIAVLVPCYNEAAAIGTVVAAFRSALPSAAIYVYDNNSRDGTAAIAASAGAVVRRQPLQGKGHVVRRMFADIDADVYVLVDGDTTYDASSAPEMIRLLLSENLDMVNGRRIETSQETYRSGHRLGNAAFSGLIAVLFGNRIRDLLSGYRVFSRRFVKSFPIASGGFQIETEMTVHALELGLPVGEVDTPYYARPEGSVSKLNTYSDGLRILSMVARLLINLKPVETFSAIAAACVMASLAIGLPLFYWFAQTGQVPKLPSAVLACGFMILACVLACTGIALGGSSRGRREAKQMAYLAQPGPGCRRQDPEITR